MSQESTSTPAKQMKMADGSHETEQGQSSVNARRLKRRPHRRIDMVNVFWFDCTSSEEEEEDEDTPSDSESKETVVVKVTAEDIKKLKNSILDVEEEVKKLHNKNILDSFRNDQSTRCPTKLMRMFMSFFASKHSSQVVIADPKLFGAVVYNVATFEWYGEWKESSIERDTRWLKKNVKEKVNNALELAKFFFQSKFVLLPAHPKSIWTTILIQNKKDSSTGSINSSFYLLDSSRKNNMDREKCISNAVIVFIKEIGMLFNQNIDGDPATARFGEVRRMSVPETIPRSRFNRENDLMTLYYIERLLLNIGEFEKKDEDIQWDVIFPEKVPDVQKHRNDMFVELNVAAADPKLVPVISEDV